MRKLLNTPISQDNISHTLLGITKIKDDKFYDNEYDLSSEKFKQYLSESEFILQLSISEGFPNALCEAMLCKCIPIGSSVGAIPNIIEDTGFIIDSSNFDIVKSEFNKIILLSQEDKLSLATNARTRIAKEFPLSKREKAFLNLVEDQ